MTASCGQEQTGWITTVILSRALQYQHGGRQLLRFTCHPDFLLYSSTKSCHFPIKAGWLCFEWDHEISTVLQRQQHRVRYSESVETGSVIFPLSGIAFILSDTQDLLMTGEEEFFKRIQKFINIHRNSFLVLSAALHGSEEWSVMFRIQRRFLNSNLRIIPVHNPAETVKLMLTMAKITSKPQADDIRCKMEITKAQIIEKSPVWKMLQEYQLHCN